MEITNVKRFYIDVAIILCLMFGFGFLPAIDPITPQGMRVIGLLLGCIYAWTIGSQIWPSLLALFILGFTQGNTVNGVFSAAFGNTTLLMVLFCLIFCYCVEQSGLLSVIANFILSRKFVQKGPWWLAFGFFLASCIASALCGQPAVSLFLWAIFYDVVDKSGLKPKSPYVAMVIIGITLVGYLGNAIMPFGLFLQIGVGIMTAVNPGFEMNYLAYTVTDLIICAIMVPGLTLAFKLICPKFEFNLPKDILENPDLSMNLAQKITLVSVIIVTLILTAPTFLPKGTAIHTFFNNFGIIGAMGGMSVILMVIIIKGKPIGDINEAMKNMPWGLIFLLSAALTIAEAVTAEGTGVQEALTAVFSPMLGGKTALIFMAIIIFVGCIITNCLNNIVTMTLMIPTSMAFAATYGVSPELIVTIFAIILYQGLVLPSGSILGALLHANNNWLTAKQIYMYATYGELLLALVMSVIAIPIAYFFIF